MKTGHPNLQGQQGIVLATALIILMVMSVLAVSMMRNFGTMERIADTTRDKQRAFNAAQNSLQYAEWWLTQGNAGGGTVCTGVIEKTGKPYVCSNALVSNSPGADNALLATVPWTNQAGTKLGVRYAPPDMNSGKTESSYADDTYWYVTPLGVDPTGTLQLFEVSAWAQGGSANSVAVVQSVYGVKSTIIDAGAL